MKTAAFIALAGLAAVASAQVTAQVMLTHNDADNTILVGDTVTWTLTIGFTGGAAATGGNMAITGDNALGTSSAMTYGAANGGNNGGSSNGAGIGFVSWTNSLFLEAFGNPADHSNPYVVGTFTFTAGAAGTLNYAIGVGQASSAFVSVGQSAFGDTPLMITDAGVTISAQTLNIVPSPASAALLGLGGLVAVRRRR